MVKYYYVKTIFDLSDVKVARRTMFFITPPFEFLDVRNYLAPGLSYDGWCKANECKMQKLAFTC